MTRAVEVVCKRLGGRLGVDVDDRLKAMSKKRKFLIKTVPPLEVRNNVNHRIALMIYNRPLNLIIKTLNFNMIIY